MATTLLLLRHGESVWNAEGRWQGQSGTGLTETGRQQAADVARELAIDPPAAVYASDLQRTRETAAIVAGVLDLPVTLDDRLREIDVGEWAGLTRDEVTARFPGATRWRDGESHEAMGSRVVAGLRAIAAAHDGKRVLIVTHGGPIRAAWIECEGAFDGREISNCHVEFVRVEAGKMSRVD